MADLFIKQAEQYAEGRPSYPPELFEFIASKTTSHDLVWDLGAGSGQASRSIAGIYKNVIAIDTSPKQLAFAPRPTIGLTSLISTNKRSGYSKNLMVSYLLGATPCQKLMNQSMQSSNPIKTLLWSLIGIRHVNWWTTSTRPSIFHLSQWMELIILGHFHL